MKQPILLNLEVYKTFKNKINLKPILFIYLFFNFYFILLYNTVLVLPYIDMNPPRVYTSSQSWIPLSPPTSLPISSL